MIRTYTVVEELILRATYWTLAREHGIVGGMQFSGCPRSMSYKH